jgi:hypothetical protein
MTAGGGASLSVGVRERRRPFLNPALSSHYGVARAALSSPKAPPSRVRQLVLLLLAAGLSGFTILQGISPHDEGLMLQAGARIASGQWPYRDFWLNYPPGQPLVLAALHEMVGNSLLAWRVLATVVQAGVALEAYRLTRRRAPESYALLAWLAVAAVMAWPSLPGPNPPALALALGGILAARSRPSLGGALAGLAFAFRFELGVAAILGATLEAPRGARLRTAAFGVVFAVVPLVPFYLAAPHAMYHDTIGFYAIQDLQRLPFPIGFSGPLRPSKLIEFYIPLILVVSLALWALAMVVAIGTRGRSAHATAALRGGIVARARARAPEAGAWSLAPLALVGLGYLLGRTDEFHLVPLAAVLPVMLAWAAAAARQLPMRIVLLVGLLLIAVYGVERRAGQALHPPALAAVPGPAGDGVKTDPTDARSLAGLEAEVAGITHPGEPILVVPPRLDRVNAGDPLLYIILGHPNPTRYDVMQPGVVTTAPVQREMVASLQSSHTRVVIRWLDPRATLVEPNGSGRSSGVHIMDRYLASQFRPVARFGVYQVLVRGRRRQ